MVSCKCSLKPIQWYRYIIFFWVSTATLGGIDQPGMLQGHAPGKFQAYVEVELKQLKEHLSILTGRIWRGWLSRVGICWGRTLMDQSLCLMLGWVPISNVSHESSFVVGRYQRTSSEFWILAYSCCGSYSVSYVVILFIIVTLLLFLIEFPTALPKGTRKFINYHSTQRKSKAKAKVFSSIISLRIRVLWCFVKYF